MARLYQFARVFTISTVLLMPAINFRANDVFADAMAGKEQPPSARTQTIADFFLNIYNTNKDKIERKFQSLYQRTVREGLEVSPENKRLFMVAQFLHELVKSDGVLGNLYSFDRYEGITPQSMLNAIFSSKPRIIVDGKPTYVLARCDRLEMLYTAILRDIFKIPARVVLIFPNHTSTEVPLTNGYLIFDNSFGLFEFSKTKAKDKPPADGRYSIEGTNSRAKLKTSVVLDERGVERVTSTVDGYLSN